MFLLVPAYPGCPVQTAVKWLLLLLLLLLLTVKCHLQVHQLDQCTSPVGYIENK